MAAWNSTSTATSAFNTWAGGHQLPAGGCDLPPDAEVPPASRESLYRFTRASASTLIRDGTVGGGHDDLGNCWEEGYEQTRELRKCLGCDCGHPRAGCESESAGRTDAEDRSTPEETRLDTGRSGEPLRRDAATGQRSAPRPGLALLARRAGQHRDGAGLPRASILKLPEPCSPLSVRAA